MYILAMLTMLDKHLLLSTTALRCLQETWSGPGVDKLLHFVIVFLNSSFKKVGHSKGGFESISSKSCKFTWWLCTE